MAYPPVVIVDDNDKVIGAAMLQEAWQKGLRYRTLSVAIFDERGNLLLQKRAANKELDPGTWDISAGGHVNEGQTYESAAASRMHEELGLQAVAVKPFSVVRWDGEMEGRQMNHFNKLFHATIAHDAPLEIDPKELSEVRWFSPEEFRQLLKDTPEMFSPFLRREYARTPEWLEPPRVTADMAA